MTPETFAHIPQGPFLRFILSLADDELVLGHRDSEWTGHAPILEEDIALSNIAQDEIGHSLVWLALYEKLSGRSPDSMAFERSWKDFRCCRLVSYPIGDFAYTVTRQYLFDAAEQVRLRALSDSSSSSLREIAGKLDREEAYHLLHTRGLVERLGDATEESHRRMQAALDQAFPQALGLFESLDGEEELIAGRVFPGNGALRDGWLEEVVPVLNGASLHLPIKKEKQHWVIGCTADEGGRRGKHVEQLKQLVGDMQMVFRLAPSAKW